MEQQEAATASDLQRKRYRIEDEKQQATGPSDGEEE